MMVTVPAGRSCVSLIKSLYIHFPKPTQSSTSVWTPSNENLFDDTKIFGDKISTISYKAIDLLIENKRLNILEIVAKKYKVLFDELKGIQLAKVTTAIPLTDVLKKQVLAKVKELTGKEATLQNIVNTDIIGGFILRVGDIQYDASVANKLQVLKRQFDNNSFVSKL